MNLATPRIDTPLNRRISRRFVVQKGGEAMEAHGGFLCRYEDVDVAWLARLSREALVEEGFRAEDAGLQLSVLPGPNVLRVAYDAPFTYGRPGAHWYRAHTALARRLSSHLKTVVHGYVFDPDELEEVLSFGDGRRVGGQCLRYEDGELPEEEEGLDEDEAFEAAKQSWPLGHLARVFGVKREALLRLPRERMVLIDLAEDQPHKPLWQLFPDALAALQRRAAFVIS